MFLWWVCFSQVWIVLFSLTLGDVDFASASAVIHRPFGRPCPRCCVRRVVCKSVHTEPFALFLVETVEVVDAVAPGSKSWV